MDPMSNDPIWGDATDSTPGNGEVVFTPASSVVSTSYTEHNPINLQMNLQIRSQSPPRNESGVLLPDLQVTRKKGRKGHTKSRTGCLNCKRARIKCKENKPACDYCAHRNLTCEWPDLQINYTTSSSAGTLSLRNRSSQAPPDKFDGLVAQRELPISLPNVLPVFTMQDFRLFNLFIKEVYPHQPIGNDAVWKHDIPSISHNYDYLLHSMLALSASELATSIEPTPEMQSTALTHRVKAITSLNLAVQRGVTSWEEGNAMLATCFTLLFQSCLIEDGLVEYMSFIRGTLSIGTQMGMRGMKFLFDKIFEQDQLKQVDTPMKQTDLLQGEIVSAALRSLERFECLCHEKVQKQAFAVLLGIARTLITSGWEGYLQLRKMYELFSYSMTQAEFNMYCDPSNEANKLLHAHFVALQIIMAPITIHEAKIKEEATGKRDDQNSGKTVLWLVGIHNRANPEMMMYYRWTRWVQQETLSGRLYKGILSPDAMRDLQDIST